MYCTLGDASERTPLDPTHAAGMFDVLVANAFQSGVGTAPPMHEIRSRPSARPVLTDGAASSVGSIRFRNCPTPPRRILPLPSCHVNPSRGLSAKVDGALSF